MMLGRTWMTSSIARHSSNAERRQDSCVEPVNLVVDGRRVSMRCAAAASRVSSFYVVRRRAAASAAAAADQAE